MKQIVSASEFRLKLLRIPNSSRENTTRCVILVAPHHRIAMQVADRLLVRPLDFKVGRYDPVNSAIRSATVSAVYTFLAEFNLEKYRQCIKSNICTRLYIVAMPYVYYSVHQ